LAWKIELGESARKELSKINKADARRIVKFLFQRVSTAEDPRSLGQAMKGMMLGDFWRYRVGDYRLICDIRDKVLVVLVLRVGHRKEVYK
jgi:mRNA interferase RelE/StbE